jgi:hypothetical protein
MCGTLWSRVVIMLLQVLVAVDETIWVIDDHSATDQSLPPGCGGVASMAVSPNGSFLAVACLDGKLRVLLSGECSTHLGLHAMSIQT